MKLEPVFVEIADPRIKAALPAEVRVYSSLEGENPGGSIKDRMVLGELTHLLARGELRPGDAVAEASQGSTARSLAHYCRELGLRSVLFVPDGMRAEDVAALRDLGADVHPVPMASGQAMYESFCAKNGIRPFNQLMDTTKQRHYRLLGEAIERELGPISLIVGTIGTGHSLLGTASGLAHHGPTATAEPASGYVNGIRNIEQVRHGAADPCVPVLFDQRVVVEEAGYFPTRELETDRGPITVTDSFRVALGALSRLPLSSGSHVFVLGAANRRRGSLAPNSELP